jgi:hypothetical protein
MAGKACGNKSGPGHSTTRLLRPTLHPLLRLTQVRVIQEVAVRG